MDFFFFVFFKILFYLFWYFNLIFLYEVLFMIYLVEFINLNLRVCVCARMYVSFIMVENYKYLIINIFFVFKNCKKLKKVL